MFRSDFWTFSVAEYRVEVAISILKLYIKQEFKDLLVGCK